MDIIVVLSDTPAKDVSKGDKAIEFLKKILDNKLKRRSYSIHRLSYDGNLDHISKTEGLRLAQPILDEIEATHPKVILTMGLVALQAMGVETTSLSGLCNVPQKFPFGGAPVIKKIKTGAPTPNPVRGLYYTRGVTLNLVSHTDILVYPTHSFQNLLSYVSGYKGHQFFERQLDRISEILDEYPNWTPYTSYPVEIPNTIEEMIASINSFKGSPYLAFDIETAGWGVPKEAQLNYAHPQAEITLIGIGNKDKAYVYNTHTYPELIPHLKALLEEPAKHLTWNGKFDIEFLTYLWGVEFHHTHIDGMTCLYLADLNMQFLGKGSLTLKFASSVFMKKGAKLAGYQKNAGIDIAIKEGDGQYLVDHLQEYMLYCGVDVWATFKTAGLLYNSLNSKTQSLATGFYQSLALTLNRIHKSGIRIDIPKMEQYIADIEVFLADIEERLNKLYPGVNPRSNEECAEIMYNKRGLTVHYTEKGNYSVSADILETFPTDEFCKLVADHRAFEKQLQILKVVKKHAKGDRCFPYYNFYRTTSGRLSAQDPPIHIIPKNKKIVTKTNVTERPENLEPWLFRKPWTNHKLDFDGTWQIIETSPNFKDIFVPDHGFTLLYGDYSQLEIVILANLIEQCSSDKTLQNAIRSGTDLHSYTASLLYSALRHETIEADFIKKNKDKDPYMSWRQNAKSVIFKLIYGGTYKSLAEEKNITLDEAKEIWDTFLRVIPGISDYATSSIANARINKYAEAWGGHTRDLWVYKYESNNNKAKNIALNHPIQSTASYLVLEAMLKLHERLPEIHSKARILLTVHDSIAVQVPEDKVQQGLTLMRETMLDYLYAKFPDLLVVPLNVSYEYGCSWHNLRKA